MTAGADVGADCSARDDGPLTVDFRRWLASLVFEPLKKLSYFRRFFVEAGTLVWPNGADCPVPMDDLPRRRRGTSGRSCELAARRRRLEPAREDPWRPEGGGLASSGAGPLLHEHSRGGSARILGPDDEGAAARGTPGVAHPPDGGASRPCPWVQRLSRARVGRAAAAFDEAGLRMPIEDSYIAATARRHALTIVTGNDRHFRRPGIEVFNPFRGRSLTRSRACWRRIIGPTRATDTVLARHRPPDSLRPALLPP